MGLVLLVGSPSFVFAAESEKTSDVERDRMVEKYDLNTGYSMKASLKELGYTESEIVEMEENFKEIEPYFETNENGGVTFDAKAALANGADKKIVASVKDDFTRFNFSKDGLRLQADCPGYNYYWFQQNVLFMDNCVTKDIIWFLLKGAAYYTIVGLISSLFSPPAGVAVGVAGVLVGLGAGYLSLYNRGYGYSIFVTRNPMEVYPQ